MAPKIDLRGRKFLGYARVSTEDQAETGHSLEAQPDQIREYAGPLGIDLVEVIEDAGKSAKSLDRPGIRRVLSMLDRGEVLGLVVTKLDRLTRNIADWEHLVTRYFLAPIGDPKGRVLLSAGDTIDTRTATGRMGHRILVSVDQYQLESSAEKTAQTMRHKRQVSEITGHARYGSTVDAADPRRSKRTSSPIAVVPCPDELLTLELIRQLAGDGLGPQAIAEALNTRGIPTKRGKGSWSRSTVHDLLKRQPG